jgi:DNA repair ATPase RecN
LADEEKKVFKLVTRLKDSWYEIGNSIEGIPKYKDTMEEGFAGLTKNLLKDSKDVRSTLELASQELRGVMVGKSGAINKMYKESASSVDRLVEKLEEHVDALNKMAEYKKNLPSLQKKHGEVAESLKNRAATFQNNKGRYDSLKSAYDKKQEGIIGRFDSENSSLLGEFKGALSPVTEGCVLKMSGNQATVDEFFNIAVVEGMNGKVDIEPVSVKGLKGILSGKESTEIRSRLGFIRMHVNESRARFGKMKAERFHREEEILEEFSDLPKLHRKLEEMEEDLKKEKASEEELQKRISEMEGFLAKKSRFSGKNGVLHIRDSLHEIYGSAHTGLRPFFDFCQKNLEGFEFPQKDIEKRELQSKVKELETWLDELYKEKDSLLHTIKKTQKDLKETDFKLTKTEGELKNITSSLEESNALAGRLDGELKELSQAHDSLQLESEDFSRTIERLRPLEDLKKQLEVEVSALKKQGKEKTSSIKAFEGENEELRSEVALLKKLGEGWARTMWTSKAR